MLITMVIHNTYFIWFEYDFVESFAFQQGLFSPTGIVDKVLFAGAYSLYQISDIIIDLLFCWH